MGKRRTFHLVTLGCKVNQYESQSLRESWQAQGWRESDPEAAVVMVVNSCAITAKAVADVRAEVRKLHRIAPDAAIVITGCASAAAGDELAALPGVRMLVGQQEKTRMLGRSFLDAFERDFPAEPKKMMNCPDAPPPDCDASEEPFPAFTVNGYARSRAVLKIQDGCSHCCSYCIVPRARGRTRSRPVEDSLAEARRLLEAGFGEIVISGVNLRQYTHGAEHDFWDFIALLEKQFAQQWAGRSRFRISSLEPGQLNEKALEMLANSRLIAPQLHLSLQSGSRSVLERMRRGHYRPEAVAGFLERLRSLWPVFGLGTDVISGFPGETDEEHEATVSLLKALPLTYAHVFPYSARPGTVAAAMPEQVASGIKKQRAAVLRTIATQRKNDFAQRLATLPEVTVAVESGEAHGINEYYVECVFVNADGTADISSFAAGSLQPARPLRAEKGRLLVTAEAEHV